MIVDLAIYFSGKKACLYASVARIFDQEAGVDAPGRQFSELILRDRSLRIRETVR